VCSVCVAVRVRIVSSVCLAVRVRIVCSVCLAVRVKVACVDEDCERYIISGRLN
jgi:hypothetical protein